MMPAAVFLIALLYAAVGHAGASGYLAVMALAGVSPAVMKPSALVLNVLVSSIAVFRFCHAGAFTARLFWPLAAGSVPLAFIGGGLSLPDGAYRALVGAVLIFSALRIVSISSAKEGALTAPPRWPVLVLLGAGLGFLSGLTGVGGGVFLSPLLLFFRWTNTRAISGVAAAFILVNSLAALCGLSVAPGGLLPGMAGLALAAVAGGVVGAEWGSRRSGVPAIRRVLGLVVMIAGVKMVLA